MKTIRQLADELGVSKTAIRNCMDDDFRAKYTEKDSKGVIRINPDGCKVISEYYRKTAEKTENEIPKTGENAVSGDMVALLQTTIETLREQLAVKDRQIAELTRLADQAQALHAGTIKQALPEAANAEPAVADSEQSAEVASDEKESPKKKTFWQRVFGG